ncbi:MYG1 family protein [Shewanella psychropiezotolerans]|uniref:MYG1 family protein n=1 Tax=Shewanella psychropiezotolerans TaxID=2593655 RepID=A0ABX5X021_9GAMM|nr:MULTISPECIES: MYG1 family protein [Shewanella]MPY21714.1 MYG1 family protein [Shewanella sp. YLB-07]QDO84700.1 MYG1 family protein [Shewanella psychropiezotolerans]
MNDITIVTHDGNFHADDVFSIAALKCVFPTFNLVRTRNADIIAKADVVLDVGGEYDPDAGRFDHHQRGGAGEREDGIPYSSFGLIWKKYGLEICQGDQELATSVDAGLVSTIDAIDCGHVTGVATGISLSHTISMFNPTWQEEGDFDASFNEAVDFASRILTRFIASANGGISAKAIVAKAIDDAEDPRVIVLEKYTPWKRTVHALSEAALYVVYPSQSGQWRIQTVPAELGSFEDRKSLPKAWAGLNGTALQEVTGIDDAMFCHNGLFIAGAESFASTMKMASIALAEQ